MKTQSRWRESIAILGRAKRPHCESDDTMQREQSSCKLLSLEVPAPGYPSIQNGQWQRLTQLPMIDMDIPLLPDIEPAQQLELENESFRLIHFHTMINFITTFCFCQCNGHWRYDKEDTKYGLSTRLHFSCSRCLDRQAWDTSPQIKLRDQSHTKERAHKEPKNQPLINVRATLASITLGGGASLLDRLFGFLHAGAAVNFVLSKKNIPLVHITGSYDACWSKRSHTHHGSASAGTGCNGRWRYDKEDTKYGLSTRLHFSCSRCLDRQAWDTSPQIKLRDQSHTKERAHKEPKNQPLINVRATLASITLGGGASLLDRLFGFLHVPHLMTHRTFDKISRKIGSIIGIIAEESKEKSCHTEVSLSEEAGAAVNFVLSKKNIPLDACWSKRSHMHHGSASAGTGVVIGQKSHKVILHGVRCKECDICRVGEEKVAKGVWKKVKDHYCSRNWHQSAKAMEADIAVQCFLEASDHGMIISTLIGDEDSSVQKHLRDLEDVIEPIEKLSDFTHIKRNFGSQLYGLLASFKGIKMERGKAFNPDKIKRIQSAFRMAVKQNVGDWEGLQRNLRTIVPHYYGEHTHCGEWCKGRGNPQWQSILNHTGLRSQLNSIIKTFACDVNARKIAHMSSSQQNETFNSVLRHYSPKDTNKGRSVAYTSCVDLAIIHFNEGSSAAYKMIAERFSNQQRQIDELRETLNQPDPEDQRAGAGTETSVPLLSQRTDQVATWANRSTYEKIVVLLPAGSIAVSFAVGVVLGFVLEVAVYNAYLRVSANRSNFSLSRDHAQVFGPYRAVSSWTSSRASTGPWSVFHHLKKMHRAISQGNNTPNPMSNGDATKEYQFLAPAATSVLTSKFELVASTLTVSFDAACRCDAGDPSAVAAGTYYVDRSPAAQGATPTGPLWGSTGLSGSILHSGGSGCRMTVNDIAEAVQMVLREFNTSNIGQVEQTKPQIIRRDLSSVGSKAQAKAFNNARVLQDSYVKPTNFTGQIKEPAQADQCIEYIKRGSATYGYKSTQLVLHNVTSVYDLELFIGDLWVKGGTGITATPRPFTGHLSDALMLLGLKNTETLATSWSKCLSQLKLEFAALQHISCHLLVDFKEYHFIWFNNKVQLVTIGSILLSLNYLGKIGKMQAEEEEEINSVPSDEDDEGCGAPQKGIYRTMQLKKFYDLVDLLCRNGEANCNLEGYDKVCMLFPEMFVSQPGVGHY
ncbi:hypothetical protein PROFUN_15923 [Planoprotostelium fungivorum]|uniref:Mutator-like transposase domain-containing protein n=1 Tax=Planoprotostelium fungivorum TaxID=1890364 RepID=A0A2P6MT77_9EUKA|nr:hypothetical protein PROFUN_15923 [Planoprotostelium fungivorum]